MDIQTYTPRFTSTDLQAQITARIHELAKETDLARASAEMLRYLDTCARFHQYSLFNVFQILMTRPDATTVAGFKKWQSLNRFVRKGEHGIPILAPVLVKRALPDGLDDEKLVGFKVVYVFDISQTDGDPLPEPPNWKSPEKNLELQERLVAFAEQHGIEVQVKHIGRDIQGVSRGGKIVLDPEAGTKTLIHEIAHELLHHSPDMPLDKAIRELEAESVAYVVARHFGMSELASPNYNALCGVTSDLIMNHLDRIRSTAAAIIQALKFSRDDDVDNFR